MRDHRGAPRVASSRGSCRGTSQSPLSGLRGSPRAGVVRGSCPRPERRRRRQQTRWTASGRDARSEAWRLPDPPCPVLPAGGAADENSGQRQPLQLLHGIRRWVSKWCDCCRGRSWSCNGNEIGAESDSSALPGTETWAVSHVLMATRLICGACNPQCWAGLDWSCARVAQHRRRTAGAGMDDKLASCNGALIFSGLSSTDSWFQRPACLALASLMTRALRATGTLTKPIGRAHGGRGGVRGSGMVPGTLSMLWSATGPIRCHGRGLKAWSKWPWAVVHAGGPATANQCGA